MYLSLMLTAEDHTQCWGDTPSPLGHISSWEETNREQRGWWEEEEEVGRISWCIKDQQDGALYKSSLTRGLGNNSTFWVIYFHWSRSDHHMVSVYMILVKHVWRIVPGLIISFFAAFLFNSVQSREADMQETWRERVRQRVREGVMACNKGPWAIFESEGVAVYTAFVSAPRPSWRPVRCINNRWSADHSMEQLLHNLAFYLFISFLPFWGQSCNYSFFSELIQFFHNHELNIRKQWKMAAWHMTASTFFFLTQSCCKC